MFTGEDWWTRRSHLSYTKSMQATARAGMLGFFDPDGAYAQATHEAQRITDGEGYSTGGALILGASGQDFFQRTAAQTQYFAMLGASGARGGRYVPGQGGSPWNLVIPGAITSTKGPIFNAPKEPPKGWYMKDAPKLPLDRYEPKSGMWNDATIPPIRGNQPTNFWLEIVHA
jgi:hypothetical protein